MPREPPATLLCLPMIVGAGQGRNSSLKFSSCITFDKVQLQSLGQHSPGTQRENVDLLPRPGGAPSTAVQRKQLFVDFSLGFTGACGLQLEWQGKRAEPVWEGTLFKMAKAAEEAAAECLGHVLEAPVLEVQALDPTGSSELHSHDAFRREWCLPHCVVLKDRSPFSFQSI